MSIQDQVTKLNAAVSAMRGLISGVRDPAVLHALSSNFVSYGCKVGEGTSAADLYLELDGSAVNVNPDRVASAVRHYEYSNTAVVYGTAFLSDDINTADTADDRLLINTADGANPRFDIVYLGINNSGAVVGIAEGTPHASATPLSTEDFGNTYDPAIPAGTMAIARVWVEASATGIADAKIHDLRGFLGGQENIVSTSAGVAASLSKQSTFITTNGDSDLDNVTLANGYYGQVKHFAVKAVGNAADSVKITPATFPEGTQITFGANPLGNGCTMVYTSAGWVVISNNGGTIA